MKDPLHDDLRAIALRCPPLMRRAIMHASATAAIDADELGLHEQADTWRDLYRAIDRDWVGERVQPPKPPAA